MQKIDYEELAKRLAIRGIRGYKQRFIQEEDLIGGEDKRKILEEVDKIIEEIKEDKFYKRKAEELQEVRPEKLTGEAKRLFEAIMIIADRKDEAEADLYEANNRIADLLLILGDRDRMINKMSEQLTTPVHDKEWVIKYYEMECKNGN